MVIFHHIDVRCRHQSEEVGDVTSTSTQSSELLLILEDDEDAGDTIGVIIEVVKVISVASEMNISIRQSTFSILLTIIIYL